MKFESANARRHLTLARESPRIPLELQLGSDRFRVSAAGGDVLLERGSAKNPDAVISTQANTLAAIVFFGRSLSKAIDTGDVRIEGDRRFFERFLALFPSLGSADETHWKA